MTKEINFTEKPFQSIKDACNSTGLSQHFLRQGVIAGTIPHIRAGKKIFVNVPLLIQQMNAESVKSTG